MIPVVFDCGVLLSAIGIVSNDRDLLSLEKPFGVSIVTPIQLLLHVRSQSQR